MKKAPLYTSEADLCADFIAWAQQQTPKWTAYAETAGWDILLVAEDGTQIGIQAKLKFNMKVLHQTIPGSWEAWRETGPDYRAILIPEGDGIVSDICGALGVTAFAAERWSSRDQRTFAPALSLDGRSRSDTFHYWSPKKREQLPDYVPDVVAGASGPVQLTKWKVAALRVIAVLVVRGYVTRQDFKTHQIDPRRWMAASGWLEKGANPGEFVRGPALDFDAQHPDVFAQILAEVRAKFATQGDMESPRPAAAQAALLEGVA